MKYWYRVLGSSNTIQAAEVTAELQERGVTFDYFEHRGSRGWRVTEAEAQARLDWELGDDGIAVPVLPLDPVGNGYLMWQQKAGDPAIDWPRLGGDANAPPAEWRRG